MKDTEEESKTLITVREGEEERARPENIPPTEAAAAAGKKGDASLHHAIAEQDLPLCLRLLQDEAKVNALDERDGSTPLHALARKKWQDGSVEVAARLLEQGAKVNAKDHAAHTPLHIAARDGRLLLCRAILAHHHHPAGGRLNLNVRRKSDEMTPLHYAAREGQSHVVELLLQEGADPKVLDKRRWLPVHHAASKGYKDCCRLLAASYTRGTSPDVPPPLALAALKGYYRCCRELAPGEDSLRYCDTASNTPLHVVAKKGFNVFVELLLELGADVEARNRSGNTPLMEAVRNKKLQCVQVLAEQGGASLAQMNHEQSTVLHLAASSRAHKCLEYLLNCKHIEDQLNVRDSRNLSALSIAAHKMDETSFTLLIQAGASPACSPGQSLLHFRPVYRRPGMLETILSHGGHDVKFSDDKGVTPLHLAAEEGSKPACSLLLARGARINALDNNGKSPLHVGAAASQAEVLRFLVNNGALLRAKDYTTKSTALHAAAAAGSLECCQILLDADSGLQSEHNEANKYALDVAFEAGHHRVMRLLLDTFKSLPKDLRKRLHGYTHRSVHTKDRVMVEVMLRSRWWQVGCGLDAAAAAAEPSCSIFRDIIRPYPDIAREVMTRCRKGSLNNFRLLENTCMVRGDHPVGVMAGCEELALLQHPLVEAWLRYKWCSYARWLFLLLLLLRLFTVWALLCFLLYTANWTQVVKRYNLTEEELCGGLGVKEEVEEEEAATPLTYSGAFNALLVHLQLAASLVVQVAAEVVCLKKTRRPSSEVLVLRLPSMVLSLAALLPTSPCDLTHGIKSVYAWECGIVSLLLSWLDLIHNINKLPQFTMFSALNTNFLKGYVKGLLYLGMVVFVFSFTFHLLLREQASFSSVPMAMVQVVVWMAGDLNYDENFLDANLDYPLLSISLFLLFVCTVGAFLVTLVKSPSSNKKRLRYYKQTSRIHLLLQIDVCFPWFRRLCLAYEYDETERIPNLLVRIVQHLKGDAGDAKGVTEVFTRSTPRLLQGRDSPDVAAPPATRGCCNVEKLVAYFENMADFFQTDDNDDDDDDDEAAGYSVDLALVTKTLEQHTLMLHDLASRLDQLLQCCDDRNTFRPPPATLPATPRRNTT